VVEQENGEVLEETDGEQPVAVPAEAESADAEPADTEDEPEPAA
jgi:hypothetical protein